MEHVHYDIEKIERGIREMYRNAPIELIHEDPEVAAAFRRSADIMCASTRFILNEIQSGTPPRIVIATFEAVITNLIVNGLDSFQHDPDQGCIVCKFLGAVHESVHDAMRNREAGSFSDHVIAVSPVPSGRA